MKYCRYCGKQIDGDSSFCTHCGSSQVLQNNSAYSYNKIGELIIRFLNTLKRMKRNIKLPKVRNNKTFARLKKCMKRIAIILLSLVITGLLVLLGFWLYGFYETSKWIKEDQQREAIAINDITKADSIARTLFQEYADNKHCYNFNGSKCGYPHIEKGFEILRNAADRGDANAQFTLGCIYAGARYDSNYMDWDENYTMLGDIIDNGRAAYWYNESANNGNASAMGNLANNYRYGIGVEKDIYKATELMRTAAEKGINWAQLNYGDMLRDGDIWVIYVDSLSGVSTTFHMPKRLDIAKLWWKKALENGNKYARERLEQIYKNDNPHTYKNILGNYTYVPDDVLSGYNALLNPHGKGTAYFDDGRVYHGTFVNGDLSGEDAKFVFKNGDIFEGTFHNNLFSKGKYTINEDKSYFIGTFKDGNPLDGDWYTKEGTLIYNQ